MFMATEGAFDTVITVEAVVNQSNKQLRAVGAVHLCFDFTVMFQRVVAHYCLRASLSILSMLTMESVFALIALARLRILEDDITSPTPKTKIAAL